MPDPNPKPEKKPDTAKPSDLTADSDEEFFGMDLDEGGGNSADDLLGGLGLEDED